MRNINREFPNDSPMNSPSGSASVGLSAFAPFGTTVLYILLAAYSRISAGHWPKYHEYLTVSHSPIFMLLGAAFLLSGVLSLVSAFVFWGRWRWWEAAVFLAAWVLLVALVMADPFGFTSFLID
jgi:hypothetical protein